MLINNLHRMEPDSRAGRDAQRGHWRHLAGHPFRDRVASGRASRSPPFGQRLLFDASRSRALPTFVAAV
jgi:hypothetical protein